MYDNFVTLGTVCGEVEEKTFASGKSIKTCWVLLPDGKRVQAATFKNSLELNSSVTVQVSFKITDNVGYTNFRVVDTTDSMKAVCFRTLYPDKEIF